MDPLNQAILDKGIPFLTANYTIVLTTGVAVILAGLLARYVAREYAESAVSYTVPAPDEIQPGWKGEVLDEPSIKARLPHRALARSNLTH